MSSRFRNNATIAVALICLSIGVFIAIFWYLAMSTNVFHAQTSPQTTYRINLNNVNVHNKTVSTHRGGSIATTPAGPDLPPSSTAPGHHPTFTNDKPLIDDVGDRGGGELAEDSFIDERVFRENGITEFEYVTPVKLHKKSLHTDDLLYESKNNGSGHNHSATHHFTGEFRKFDSLLWDPHPQYTIEAFGSNMRLDLYNDGSFIHSDLKITHAWPNETLRRQIDHKDHDKLRGCYYRGQVYADQASTVAVSLCNGMTGQIRTHQGTFMIKPLEKYAEDKRSIRHIIYRLPSTPTGDYIDDILHHGNHSEAGLGGSAASSATAAAAAGLPESNDISDAHDGVSHESEPYDHGRPISGLSELDASITLDRVDGHHATMTIDRRRRKRSVHNENNEYTMEILVAVDKKMQDYHGNEITNYVMTLMSIVSNIFADASIGNSISIAVVQIVLLQHNLAHDANGIGVSASKMLTDFCRFKKNFKHDYDTALLLTREQICRSPSEIKCDTLGLAELGTICREESCSLVQDNGLSAAFTIAHELGHILNMPHDDDLKCNQFYGSRETEHFIMSRMLGKNTHPWAWSNCSRHFVTEYLENNHGRCMLNTPTHGLIEPTTGTSQLAGEKFNQHQQCELVYGPGSKICTYMPQCSALWCVTKGDNADEGCRSQAMPWADGTSCGKPEENRWCQKANCVPRNRNALKPVDGGWGPWSAWSECSLPCGGGVQSSHRYCDSPAPANHGKYCSGNRVKYASCNTHNCQASMPDVRSQQCRNFDNNNFNIAGLNENVKWVPKYGVSTNDECKLYCRVQNTSTYFLLKHKVKDGTPCNQDGFNKCVNGHCHQAGCDNILYSDAVLDKCGVCNGRNDTCVDVNGSMTRDELRRMMEAEPTSFYHRVTVIPEGALNIEIRQSGYQDDKSFIALRGESGENLLNAESSISNFPRKFAYAGVIFQYNGANQSMEMVTSTYATALHKRMLVELLIVRTSKNDLEWLHGDNEIISYSYTIARSHTSVRDHLVQSNLNTPMVVPAQQNYPYASHHSSKRHHIQPSHHQHQSHNYQWKMSEWSECDKLCYGKRHRTAACVKLDASFKVDHKHCSAHSRPSDDSEDCNKDCNLSWSLKKSDCSTNCGDGTRTLEHICIQKFIDRANRVDDVYCPEIRNKIITETCRGSCPDALWIYGSWESCSQKCGGGVQNRTAHCYSQVGGYPVDTTYCLRMDKEHVRSCNTEPCPEWAYDENTPCSVSCGEGIKTRVLTCKQNDSLVNPSLCAHIPRPINKPMACQMPPCAAKKVPAPQIMSFDDTKSRHKDVYSIHPNSLYGQSHPKYTSTVAPSIINLKYEWKTGRWGNCSTCGSAGKRQRSVRCAKTTTSHDFRYVDDHYCDLSMRPVNVTSCADVNCNYWNFGAWSECSDSCEITRQVVCQNEQERLSDSQCDQSKRPVERKTCCHVKWRSIWTPCTATCGYGERQRKKVCMRLMPKSKTNPHPVRTGKQLDERYCQGLPEPKIAVTRRSCRKACDFYWKASNWSKCDSGCGSGIARRDVVCTNGTTMSNTECDLRKKPKKTTVCTSQEHCVWKVKKWKTCKCDGIQRVRTICMDDLRKRRSTNCNEDERPPHKQPCRPLPNCSCRDLKRHYNYYRDGEYDLNVGGRNVSIYCHAMHTNNPKEYLTLKAGNTENYALYMGNRSRELNKCPYDVNDTFEDETVPAGTTRFNKIRVKLNVDDIHVVDDDYEFALTSGRNQPFATAGDCFTTASECYRGVFHINLKDTGLVINPQTEWVYDGQNSGISWHTKLQPPYVKVVGRCGGYCGKCNPSRPLRLDVA